MFYISGGHCEKDNAMARIMGQIFKRWAQGRIDSTTSFVITT